MAIFTRRVPVEYVKTLKTWLWVFSAVDNLKNVKLHHIDYDPKWVCETISDKIEDQKFSEKK